jgi:predicted nucleic acid-binding protein
MERVATSDHVVVESWLLICSRLGRRAAMRFWDGLAANVLTVVASRRRISGAVTRSRRAWSDQTFSMVDRTSFALIERLGIRRTFAFDRHFRMVRLGWRRQLALEIVPH